MPLAVLSSFAPPASTTEFTVKQLQDRVVALFGEAYALEGAVTLADLGLEKMPLNATGKVQKLELKGPLEKWWKQREVGV